MKIRVVIRCSPVKAAYVRHRMWSIFKQVPCRIMGHTSEMKVTSGKLALKCARCGWQSPGWTLDHGRFARI